MQFLRWSNMKKENAEEKKILVQTKLIWLANKNLKSYCVIHDISAKSNGINDIFREVKNPFSQDKKTEEARGCGN